MPHYKIVRDTAGNVTMADVIEPPEGRVGPREKMVSALEEARLARKGLTMDQALVERHPTQTGPESYECQHCDFVTERATALKSHVRFKHQGE